MENNLQNINSISLFQTNNNYYAFLEKFKKKLNLNTDFEIYKDDVKINENNFGQYLFNDINSFQIRLISKNLQAGIQEFLDFNNYISSPYMTVYLIEGFLQQANFQRIYKEQPYSIQQGQSYYVKNSQGANLYCFNIPKEFEIDKLQFKVVSNEVDFPCLRLTTQSKCIQENQLHLNVGSYGESEWRNWQNRDLRLGGRVVVNINDQYECKILNTDFPIGFLSSDFFDKDKQYFYPFIGTQFKDNDQGDQHFDFLLDMIAQKLKIDKDQIIDFDLCLTSQEITNLIGVEQQLISGPRLNSSVGTWSSLITMTELVQSNKFAKNTIPFILFNNKFENHISRSKLNSILIRILKNLIKVENSDEIINAILERTFELRNFNCHSYNPFDQNDMKDQNKGAINKGLTFSYSLRNNYPTNSITKSILIKLLKSQSLEYQFYQNKEEENSIKDYWIQGVDFGIPICSKNQFRELIGYFDLVNLQSFISCFFQSNLETIYDPFEIQQLIILSIIFLNQQIKYLINLEILIMSNSILTIFTIFITFFILFLQFKTENTNQSSPDSNKIQNYDIYQNDPNLPYEIQIYMKKENYFSIHFENLKNINALQQKSISLQNTYENPQKFVSSIYNYYKFDFPQNESIEINFNSSCKFPIFFSKNSESLKNILLNDNGDIKCLFWNYQSQELFKKIKLGETKVIDNILQKDYDQTDLLFGKISNEKNEKMYGVVICILRASELQEFSFELVRKKLGIKIVENFNDQQDQQIQNYSNIIKLNPYQTINFLFQNMHLSNKISVKSNKEVFGYLLINLYVDGVKDYSQNQNQQLTPISNLMDDTQSNPENSYNRHIENAQKIDISIQNLKSTELEIKISLCSTSYDQQQKSYLIAIYISIPILIISILVLLFFYCKIKNKQNQNKKIVQKSVNNISEEILVQIQKNIQDNYQNKSLNESQEKLNLNQPQKKKEQFLLQNLYQIPEVDSNKYMSNLTTQTMSNNLNLFSYYETNPKLQSHKFLFDKNLKKINSQKTTSNEDEFSIKKLDEKQLNQSEQTHQSEFKTQINHEQDNIEKQQFLSLDPKQLDEQVKINSFLQIQIPSQNLIQQKNIEQEANKNNLSVNQQSLENLENQVFSNHQNLNNNDDLVEQELIKKKQNSLPKKNSIQSIQIINLDKQPYKNQKQEINKSNSDLNSLLSISRNIKQI